MMFQLAGAYSFFCCMVDKSDEFQYWSEVANRFPSSFCLVCPD